MQKIEIRRPTVEDQVNLNQFFQIVITDTFKKEGIIDLQDDLEDEIATKVQYLKSDFESNGIKRYFLIALIEGKVIGSIEYGPASDLIINSTYGELNNLVEVGTVFVHPDYQRQGVGNLLLKEIFQTLQINNIKEFCLDSGYKNAQKIWKKKFGEPNYLLQNYWGKGFDHMIWRIKIG